MESLEKDKIRLKRLKKIAKVCFESISEWPDYDAVNVAVIDMTIKRIARGVDRELFKD